MDRRSFLMAGFAASMAPSPVLAQTDAAKADATKADELTRSFQSIIDKFTSQDALADEVRREGETEPVDRASIKDIYDRLGQPEYQNEQGEVLAEPAPPPKERPDSFDFRRPRNVGFSKLKVSSGARDLIIFSEVTSQARYTRDLESPIWPKADSGVTIGIGYDLGYVDAATFRQDWAPYLSAAAIDRLSGACGKTGQQAKQLVDGLRDVKVPWDPAIRQFDAILLRIYTALTDQAYKNCTEINEDCLGALVSLTFNRGASSQNPPGDTKDRRREIRAIKYYMEDRAFGLIPGEFRKMTRLWKGDRDVAGLLDRREAEAILFEVGLAKMGRR